MPRKRISSLQASSGYEANVQNRCINTSKRTVAPPKTDTQTEALPARLPRVDATGNRGRSCPATAGALQDQCPSPESPASLSPASRRCPLTCRCGSPGLAAVLIGGLPDKAAWERVRASLIAKGLAPPPEGMLIDPPRENPHAQDRHRRRAGTQRHGLPAPVQRALRRARAPAAGRTPAGSRISASISCACRRATGRASATGIRTKTNSSIVLEGELTLIEDGGETVLRAGDCAAFPKNSGNGHHMINRSGATAVYLEVGSRAARRPHHLLRHRHDERQRRRPVRAQGRHALRAPIAGRNAS